MIGTALADFLLGTSERDDIFGRNGNDRLEGWAGNDVIFGGWGSDLILGGQGDDVLSGGKGKDYIGMVYGNDTAEGGQGADTFFVDARQWQVEAEAGYDFVATILDFDAEDTLHIWGLDEMGGVCVSDAGDYVSVATIYGNEIARLYETTVHEVESSIETGLVGGTMTFDELAESYL